VVLAVLVVGAGLLTSLTHAHNSSKVPHGLSVSNNAQSTALYCTGLTSTKPVGHVTFYNSSTSTRQVSVNVVSDTGHDDATVLNIPARTSDAIQPSVLDAGNTFAVAAQVSGSGVVADEVTGGDKVSAPCVAAGVHQWFATGFDTLVGSTATVSLYNPTGTAAVVNASIYTANGFVAPQSFQGVSVAAHTQTELNLGSQVVNTSNIGVAVHVLRGSLAITGVQDSNGTVSLNAGSTRATTTAWFPDVTTVNGATAQVRVANPSPNPTQITVHVALGKYDVAPQTLTLAPYQTSAITITPNSAIPAAGYATLKLRASGPVISSLATGGGKWISLSAPATLGSFFLIRNFSGLGFDAATVTNTSTHSVSFSLSDDNDGDVSGVSATPETIAAGATESLLSLAPTLATSTTSTFVLSASSNALLVGLTLPSSPKGEFVVYALNGG